MTGANGHTNELDLPLKRSLTALKWFSFWGFSLPGPSYMLWRLCVVLSIYYVRLFSCSRYQQNWSTATVCTVYTASCTSTIMSYTPVLYYYWTVSRRK
jgi:hypothetical protein